MTKIDDKTCPAYDQILDRRCRYDVGHGGCHNFARLDHDCSLERVLRRKLDEVTKDLAEALDLADAYATEAIDRGAFRPGVEALDRLAELRKRLPGAQR